MSIRPDDVRDRHSAGRRNRLIRIERAELGSADGFNNRAVQWVLFSKQWAEKFDVSDRERVAASEVGAEITTRFRIEWSENLSGVNPKDRVVHQGRIYDIAGVKELGTRQGLEITANARAD